MQKLVVIESPYAGDIAVNVTYARRCMRDSLIRGEFPFASHLLYTQPGILRDEIGSERALGMEAGFVWMTLAVNCGHGLIAVYTDYGISPGMVAGIERAEALAAEITYRKIGGNP